MVRVPLWASVFVTTTFTAPAAWAAVVAVIVVLFPTATSVAAVPPNLTVARQETGAGDAHWRPAVGCRMWAVIPVTVGAGLVAV